MPCMIHPTGDLVSSPVMTILALTQQQVEGIILEPLFVYAGIIWSYAYFSATFIGCGQEAEVCL